MKKIFYSLFFISIILSAQSEKKFFGVQTHFGQYYRADMDSANVLRMLDSLNSAGITMIRDECYWSNVETVRGVYSFPPQIDFYISQAHSRNIEVLLILNYNNPLYAAHAGAAVQTDSNRAAFVNYCKQVVQRYSPLGVKYYEIWNEPNIPLFWDPQPNAQDYAKLLQAVYPAIKSIDSTITILGCATSPAEGNPSPFINWLTFISQIKNFGGLNFLDAVSVHLYRVDISAEQFLQTDLNNLVSLIGNRPVWLSEIGYPTSTVWPNLSLDNQAKYIARLYLLARNFPQINSIVYYDLKNDGEDPPNNEHNFGLLNFNLSHKPSFIGLKQVISQTANKTFLNSSINGTNYKFAFQNANEKTFALWNRLTSVFNIEIFSKSHLRINNYDGSTYFLFDKDKSVNIEYLTSPKFVTEIDSFPSAAGYSILLASDTMVAGQKLQLSFHGKTFSGENIFVDSSAVAWHALDSLSLIDSTGRLTAKYAGTTNIRAIFENHVAQKSILILPYFSELEIEPFNSMSNFTHSFFNVDSSTQLTIVDTNFSTSSNSLLIDYKFRYKGVDKHRIIFNCDYDLPGEPDSIMIDILNNNYNHVFGIIVEDADGDQFSKSTQPSQLGAGVGWRTLKLSLTSFGSSFNYPIKLKGFTIYLVKLSGTVDSIYTGKFLIDNLRIHNGMIVATKEKISHRPEGFALYQNYPNPFNPSTIIKYAVGNASFALSTSGSKQLVTLKVFDILGREVATLVNEEKEPGVYHSQFSILNSQLTSGVYFYRLTVSGNSSDASANYTQTKKLILLK